MSAPIFLGVDGGNSKTEAVALSAEGEVLGFGRSGGSNYQGIGLSAALSAIGQAVEAALGGRRALWGAFCLAGADMRSDFAILKPSIARLPYCEHTVVYNDLRAVLRAGSTHPYGVAVVCGSGFNAGGVGREGQAFRLPALGTWTGDRGGGCALGANTMGAAFRAWDGRGAPTRLQADVLRHFGLPNMETLAEHIVQGRVTHADVCGLAPLAFRAAAAADPVAQGLIRELGQEVGVAILAVARRVALSEVPCEAVLGGSVFYGEGPLLLETVHQVVLPAAPHMQIKRLEVRPVVGAALLAMDSAHIPIDRAWLRALYAKLPPSLRLQGKAEHPSQKR